MGHVPSDMEVTHEYVQSQKLYRLRGSTQCLRCPQKLQAVTTRECKAKVTKGSFIEKVGFKQSLKEWVGFRKSKKVEEAAEMRRGENVSDTG